MVFGLLCAWGLGPGTARGQAIELVAQLDPYPGANRYADVWGEGDYAYIGSFQGSGVGIIDISDPETPVLVTTYGSGGGGQFKDIKVHGGIGYFASDNGGGVHIVDLADPTTPVLLAQITSLDGGYDDVHNVFYGNGYLYQADTATPTVKVFDVIDPASPFFVRDIVTPDPDRIHDVTVVDDRLYASGLGGFTHVYDVSADRARFGRGRFCRCRYHGSVSSEGRAHIDG